MSPRCGPYHSGEGLCFSPVTSGIGLHRDNCSLASGSMGASPQSWWGCIMPPGHPRLALSSFLLYLSLKPWLGSCRGEALSEEIHRRSFLKTVLLHPSSQLASVWVAEEPSGAEPKATKPLSARSYSSVVAAEQWRADTQSHGERASPGRQAGTLATTAILLPWVAFPSLDMVPTLRACCAMLVLTSDFGREEEMNTEHRERTDQPQTSWVPLPLGEGGALSPRMLSLDRGKGPGGDFLHPSMGVALTTTRDLQKG
ncbi:Greb1-Like Protein [Manis pentadactyla]|nr:Greb1-Like Protein [Manis pentadactyla]